MSEEKRRDKGPKHPERTHIKKSRKLIPEEKKTFLDKARWQEADDRESAAKKSMCECGHSLFNHQRRYSYWNESKTDFFGGHCEMCGKKECPRFKGDFNPRCMFILNTRGKICDMKQSDHCFGEEGDVSEQHRDSCSLFKVELGDHRRFWPKRKMAHHQFHPDRRENEGKE